jgi:very-short-patch-repair endonuclease
MLIKNRTTVARRLRREMTKTEKLLWQELREMGLPHRFRRQHPVGKHIVDFASPAAKLIIELDGGQHATRGEEDDARSLALARHGYWVIRFWNGEVMENLTGVLETIRKELEISLSALGGGEGRGEVGAFIRQRNPPHPPHRSRDGSPPPPPQAQGRRGHR